MKFCEKGMGENTHVFRGSISIQEPVTLVSQRLHRPAVVLVKLYVNRPLPPAQEVARAKTVVGRRRRARGRTRRVVGLVVERRRARRGGRGARGGRGSQRLSRTVRKGSELAEEALDGQLAVFLRRRLVVVSLLAIFVNQRVLVLDGRVELQLLPGVRAGDVQVVEKVEGSDERGDLLGR